MSRAPIFLKPLWLLPLFLLQCGDDPPADETDACGGTCFAPYLVCDPVLRQCVPAGGNDTGSRTDADAGTSDVNEMDAGSGDVTDEQDDTTAVDGTADQPNDDVSGADTPDASNDVADDQSCDGDAAPVILCPDRLENHAIDGTPHADNNLWSRAARLHETALLGQLAPCAELAFDIACQTPCEIDEPVCSELTVALCDCCECWQDSELALGCGSDDPDNYAFTLLQGDPTTIRLFPGEGTTGEDLMVMLWQPPDDHPVDELWPPVGEYTQGTWQVPIVGDPYIELEQPIAPPVGESGVLAEYVLTIIPITPGIDVLPYELVLQVGTDSRGCPGDPWDNDWESYAEDDTSETSCSTDACSVPVSTGAGNIHFVEGHICPWDLGDYFSHTVDGGSAQNTRIRVAFPSITSDLNAALFAQPVSGDPVEVDPGETWVDDGAGIERTFELQSDGTVYQLHVTGAHDARPTAYQVYFHAE